MTRPLEETAPRGDLGLEGVRKVAYAAQGAAEGLAEAFDDPKLLQVAHKAIDQGDELVATVVHHPTPTSTARRMHELADGAAHGARRIRRRTQAIVRETEDKVDAVAETAKRAARAPAAIARDVADAGKAYGSGVARQVTFYAMAGVLGAAGLIVFTVFLVTGLNMLLGAPWGALIVAALYGIAAVACISTAKAAMAAGKARAELKLRAAREEVRHVTRPVRRAFTRAPAPRTTAPASTASTIRGPDSTLRGY